MDVDHDIPEKANAEIEIQDADGDTLWVTRKNEEVYLTIKEDRNYSAVRLDIHQLRLLSKGLGAILLLMKRK